MKSSIRAAAHTALIGLLSIPPVSVLADDAATSTSASQTAPAAVSAAPTHAQRVTVLKDAQGAKLQVDGKDFMVFGMNWDYLPVGENYAYDFWGRPDEFLVEALRREMTLLKNMGVNAIRVGPDIPPRWVQHIYENYGIYSMINHTMGRYGFIVDGVWRSPIDYEDARVREVITADIVAAVDRFRGTPGVLMWLLGNENNYGLYWSSTEIEDLPLDKQNDARAQFLYTLYGDVITAIKSHDQAHPVAMANGDLQFIDLIVKYCPNLDIMGANVYRGASSGDLFEKVKEKLNLPFMYTEFGSDAYDAKLGREDGATQAEILRRQWQEIYAQSHGKGRVGNAIGGFIFQWGDGWWKYKQEVNLDVHDTTASWGNGAYPSDFVEGQNNMNEEWFGITAKTRTDTEGLYESKPRSAYYVLRRAFQLDPYAPTTNLAAIDAWFGNLRVDELGAPAETTRALADVAFLNRVRVSGLRLDLDTYSSGGQNLLDPVRQAKRFDHLQSVYTEVSAEPFSGLSARLSVNVLGNTPQNPIDEIFYEARGRPLLVRTAPDPRLPPPTVVLPQTALLTDNNRIQIYQAAFTYDSPWFSLEGFYRVGHNHWGYEGDFFGLYREAYYQEGVDAFNANAPSGMVFNGKKALEGLTVAFGPELFWGANPTIIGKYYRTIGPFSFSLMHQEDLALQGNAGTSSALPEPQSRKSTLYLSYKYGPLWLEAGGIVAGTERLNRAFTRVEAATGADSYLNSGYYVLDDKVRPSDTLGAKLKVSVMGPVLNWYVQGGYRGIVTDAGFDPTITFTGFSLKESGQGNHAALSTGGTLTFGAFQIAPNFLYQKPLVGPLVKIDDFFDPNTGAYYPGVRLRNRLQDPFWVRSNRETIAFELMLNYDPTPTTWLFAWDNIRREDAPFAASLDFVYRIQPSGQDASTGVAAEGYQFAFDGATGAQNVWEARARVVLNPTRDLHIVAWLMGGTGQANGIDGRLVKRFGGNFRAAYHRLVLEGALKINDWGPYDYHRDFGLTFPIQAMGDLSYALDVPRWLVVASSRIGIRLKVRTLDLNSPRYFIDPANDKAVGNEWEVKTYVQIAI